MHVVNKILEKEGGVFSLSSNTEYANMLLWPFLLAGDAIDIFTRSWANVYKCMISVVTISSKVKRHKWWKPW